MAAINVPAELPKYVPEDQVLPAPTEHARNLFHTSAAMWDAWAAWDPGLPGVYADLEVPAVEDLAAARAAAGR